MMVSSLAFGMSKESIQNQYSTIVAATPEHFGEHGQFLNGVYISERRFQHQQIENMKAAAEDPIILRRTKIPNVFAIVTAWGDEAYDPAIINEIYN